MVSGRIGELVSSTPITPLRIMAESALRALELFAQRAEGTILALHGCEPAIVAKMSVDGRVLRVRVSD